MQLVASLNKPNIAALGNEDGGKLYGLSVLKTILLIKRTILRVLLWWLKSLAKFHHRFPTKTLLLMTTSQQVGALVDALLVFKKHQINMTKLESRPIYGKPWEEMFYLEIEANIHHPDTNRLWKN